MSQRQRRSSPDRWFQLLAEVIESLIDRLDQQRRDSEALALMTILVPVLQNLPSELNFLLFLGVLQRLGIDVEDRLREAIQRSLTPPPPPSPVPSASPLPELRCPFCREPYWSQTRSDMVGREEAFELHLDSCQLFNILVNKIRERLQRTNPS